MGGDDRSQGWKSQALCTFFPALSCSHMAVQTPEAMEQAGARGELARHLVPSSGLWLKDADSRWMTLTRGSK